MRSSNSRSSLFSQQKPTFKVARQDTLQLCQSTQETLEQASKLLSHHQFGLFFERIIKNLILRAEVESPNSQAISLQTVKLCLSLYGGSLELNLRTLLLEILSDLNCNIFSQIEAKFEKAKHIVLQTQIEYLLSKIFLLQVRYYLTIGQTASSIKCLKKCMELNQHHMVEYMQEQQEVRKQIVDYAIVAHYQYFKIIKTQKPVQGLESLIQACNAAKKKYGQDNKVTKGLFELYSHHQNILNSLDKNSTKSRAITDILDYQSKKNCWTVAFYSWQDQKIVVQLMKVQNQERHKISEASYEIKLDMSKIKLLKSSQWITIEKGGQILINQDQLLRILGYVNNESQQKHMTTGIELRNLSKDDIVKKTFLSSEDDDEQFFAKQELGQILKYPRAQSSRKFKQTQ